MIDTAAGKHKNGQKCVTRQRVDDDDAGPGRAGPHRTNVFLQIAPKRCFAWRYTKKNCICLVWSGGKKYKFSFLLCVIFFYNNIFILKLKKHFYQIFFIIIKMQTHLINTALSKNSKLFKK